MQRIETTPEQRKEILAKVDALRKSENLTLDEAWKKAGLGHYTNYFSWKRKGKRVKATPKPKRAYRRRHVEVEMAPAPHLVALIGFWSDGNVTNMQDVKRAA